ncbi:hypothetical protein DLAC_07103 [Tieghemostelium lacteum]|uniref:Uncharacterized protein n=1 Tax=Tieghemostelium lacteum TaxID=361077 RepID=A0A151ZE71_TIELA|nr:hypothetical protein DLAC_07103 [Tieghemostelium lacteum]|eukprot:KYQ92256.1 hypothetical protein DLAC_07103 [Tieghemostelium lacteum]
MSTVVPNYLLKDIFRIYIKFLFKNKSRDVSNFGFDLTIYQLQSLQKLRLVCKEWLDLVKRELGLKLHKIWLGDSKDFKTYSFYKRFTEGIENAISLDFANKSVDYLLKQFQPVFDYTTSLRIADSGLDFKSLSKQFGEQCRFKKLSALEIQHTYHYMENRGTTHVNVMDLVTFANGIASTMESITKLKISRLCYDYTVIKQMQRLGSLKTLKLKQVKFQFSEFIEYLTQTKTLEKLVLDAIKPISNDTEYPNKVSALMTSLSTQKTIKHLAIYIPHQYEDYGSQISAESIIELLNVNSILQYLDFIHQQIHFLGDFKNGIKKIKNNTIRSVSETLVLKCWNSDSGICDIKRYRMEPTQTVLNYHLVNLQSMSVYLNRDTDDSLIQLIRMSPKKLTHLTILPEYPHSVDTQIEILDAVKDNIVITHLTFSTYVHHYNLLNFLKFHHPTLEDLTVGFITDFNLTELSQLPRFSPNLKSLKLQNNKNEYKSELFMDSKFEELLNIYCSNLIQLIDNQPYLLEIQLPTPLFYSKWSSFFHINRFDFDVHQQTLLRHAIKSHQNLHTLVLSLENSNTNSLLRESLIRHF